MLVIVEMISMIVSLAEILEKKEVG